MSRAPTCVRGEFVLSFSTRPPLCIDILQHPVVPSPVDLLPALSQSLSCSELIVLVARMQNLPVASMSKAISSSLLAPSNVNVSCLMALSNSPSTPQRTSYNAIAGRDVKVAKTLSIRRRVNLMLLVVSANPFRMAS